MQPPRYLPAVIEATYPCGAFLLFTARADGAYLFGSYGPDGEPAALSTSTQAQVRAHLVWAEEDGAVVNWAPG